MKEKQTDIVKKYGRSASDCGSSPVQIALLTERITHLSGHLKSSKKDYAAQRGLLMLVGRRRRLLSYLKRCDLPAYNTILKALDLRK